MLSGPLAQLWSRPLHCREKLLAYEYANPYRFNDDTRKRLMMEVADEDFESSPLPDRIILDDLEELIEEERVDIHTPEGFALMVDRVASSCLRTQDAIEQLRRFCRTEPRLADPSSKSFGRNQPPLGLAVGMERADIIARLESLRDTNEFASLAFYAYRDLNRVEPQPFLKAALERCPVSIEACSQMTDAAIIKAVRKLPDESIYDEAGRLAQPDEVWNYGRGDGVEKALLLANVLRARHPGAPMAIDVKPGSATLRVGDGGNTTYRFRSDKHLRPQTWDCSM